MFLEWADTNFLAPFTPESSTSLRSDRILDYALAAGLSINIQNYGGHTTSDHTPIISIIQTKIKNGIIGKNVHWKVFSLFTEYTFALWEERWNLDDIDAACNDYNRFLFLLSARCTIMFPLEKYRPSIPVELRSFLNYIRALPFRQMRTKNIELKKMSNSLRIVAKNELKSLFASQLSSLLNLRNTSTHAEQIWSKCRKHLRTSSSTIDAFIAPSGHLIKDPKEMCETAADFYEDFLKKSNIVKPHPYTDSPPADYENVEEPVPEVTFDELIYTVQTKHKKILWMLMVYLTSCLIFSINAIGRCFLNYSIIRSKQLSCLRRRKIRG